MYVSKCILVVECNKCNSIGCLSPMLLMLLFAARRYASAVYAMTLCCVCVSVRLFVCLSVCLSVRRQ